MCKSCFDFCMCIHDFCYTFHHGHSCFSMMGALIVLAIIVIIALLMKREWSHTCMSGQMVCTSDYRSCPQIILEYHIHYSIVIDHHISIS